MCQNSSANGYLDASDSGLPKVGPRTFPPGFWTHLEPVNRDDDSQRFCHASPRKPSEIVRPCRTLAFTSDCGKPRQNASRFAIQNVTGMAPLWENSGGERISPAP